MTTPNKEMIGYVSAVDKIFGDLCGVRYIELIRNGGLEGDLEYVCQNFGQRTPEQFVQETVDEFQLLTRNEVAVEFAAAFNTRRAAVINFALSSTDQGWVLGEDGRAYRTEDDGSVVRMDVANKGDKWGWIIEAADENVSLVAVQGDRLGRVIEPEDVSFSRKAVGPDIGEAIEQYEFARENEFRHGMR
jgi:hypothetical protein